MKSIIETPVLIIGAGPAGLAVAGQLRKRNIPFEIIEKSNRVGNAWHEHYDRLHLHTVKELSHLPHLPFPKHYPRYVPRQMLVEYLEDYSKHFMIKPHFVTTATSVKKDKEQWKTETDNEKIFLSNKVVIASGVNRVPYQPRFTEEENFQGTILHSKDYKNVEPFREQKVLVVGMGNTGAEIALDLCENGIESYVSIRGPVNMVPRDVFGRPTQLTALMLNKLPEGLNDAIGIFLRKLTVGDLSKYGIETPKMPPAKQLRVLGKTPVVDIGTIKQIKAGKIKVIPEIDHFTENGVVLKNGEEYQFDIVILATGYHAKVQEFLNGAEDLLDQFEVPNCCIAEGQYKGLYFIGFDNYTAGGILGTILRDSELIVQDIVDWVN